MTDTDFDIRDFLIAQKDILTILGLFGALAVYLQRLGATGDTIFLSVGITSTISLFLFVVYLFTKNLIHEFGGVMYLYLYLTRFKLKSVELTIFLTIFYTVVISVLFVGTQFRSGIIIFSKIPIILAGIVTFPAIYSVLSSLGDAPKIEDDDIPEYANRIGGFMLILMFVLFISVLTPFNLLRFSLLSFDNILSTDLIMYVYSYISGLVLFLQFTFVLWVIYNISYFSNIWLKR